MWRHYKQKYRIGQTDKILEHIAQYAEILRKIIFNDRSILWYVS